MPRRIRGEREGLNEKKITREDGIEKRKGEGARS